MNLVNWSYFYFVKVIKRAISLIISLVMNKTILVSIKIAISFLDSYDR